MKKSKKITYSHGDIGEIKIMKDFLPSPEMLLLKEDFIKVTLQLSKNSLDFFKEIANQQKVSYQKMIRSLLDHYVSHYRL